MRCLPALIVFCLVMTFAAQSHAQAPLQQWSIQGTAPVRVTLPAAKAPATAWARSADGAWLELSPEFADGRVQITLTAEAMRDGAALVVIDPPAWLALEDAGPPTVVAFTIDGADATGTQATDLGWLDEIPQVLVLRVRDEDNRLDRASVQVRTPVGVFRPGDSGVTFRPSGRRGGTLTVRPREIAGLETITRTAAHLIVDDYAIDQQDTRRSVSWALSPRMKLDDGALLIVDSVTSSGGWEDWSVVADGAIMNEGDGTTGGRTWLSDNKEGEHWMIWRLPEERMVRGVKLAWPWYETWRTSRNYDVQVLEGDEWVTRVQVRDQTEQQVTEHLFKAPVRTAGIRILQQPMGGQIDRQDLMWLSEAEVLYAE